MTSQATNLTRSSPNALASSSSVLFPTLLQKIQNFLFVSNTVEKGNEMTVRKPFDTMLTMGKMAIYCPQGSGTLRQQYTLLYSVKLCFTLLYSALHRFTLLYSALLCSTLLYSTLLCSTLLYSALLCSTLVYSVLLCYTLFYSIVLCNTL